MPIHRIYPAAAVRRGHHLSTPTFASARTPRQGPCSRAVWPSVPATQGQAAGAEELQAPCDRPAEIHRHADQGGGRGGGSGTCPRSGACTRRCGWPRRSAISGGCASPKPGTEKQPGSRTPAAQLSCWRRQWSRCGARPAHVVLADEALALEQLDRDHQPHLRCTPPAPESQEAPCVKVLPRIFTDRIIVMRVQARVDVFTPAVLNRQYQRRPHRGHGGARTAGP